MTDVPAGWYSDPATPYPGQPPTQRYWDGHGWTVHVEPVYWPYAGQPLPGQPTTPDGVPVASWLKRAGAFLIDSLVVSTVSTIVTLPAQISMQRELQSVIERLSRQDAQSLDFGSLFGDYWDAVMPLLVWSGLATLAIWVIYDGMMLRLKRATLGKMVLGLEVRLRERPGQMPWTTIGMRILVQFGYLVTAVFPLLYIAFFWYPYLDCLWPLWDKKRQALHDKAARTNVIAIR